MFAFAKAIFYSVHFIFIFLCKVMRVVIAKVTISASCLAAAKKKIA